MSDRPAEHEPAGSRFFSLKWKVGLIVSVVLIVVNSLIILAAYRQSNQQFHQQKLDLLHQQQQTISGLLQRDYEQLNSLVGFIPLLSSGGASASTGAGLSAVYPGSAQCLAGSGMGNSIALLS